MANLTFFPPPKISGITVPGTTSMIFREISGTILAYFSNIQEVSMNEYYFLNFSTPHPIFLSTKHSDTLPYPIRKHACDAQTTLPAGNPVIKRKGLA